MDTKAICAMILGCKPGELMGYKDMGAFVVVLDPVGRKFVYTREHLQDVLEESKPKEPIPEKYLEVGGLRLAAPGATPKPAKKLETGHLPKAKKIAKKTVTGGQRSAKKIAVSNPTKAKK